MPNKERLINLEIDGPIAHVKLDRPEKRNAVNLALIKEIGEFFANPPKGVRVVILSGNGKCFCAGMDLTAALETVEPLQAMDLSRVWHKALNDLQFGGLAVVVAMHGAVLGGGLEIATAAHVRVAEENAYFGLPEARRGIFVGGGASVRVSRIIGSGRMTEMMLTGHEYGADEAIKLGLVHRVVPEGKGLDKAKELANIIVENAEITNYLAIQALPRIETMGNNEGLFTEAIAAALPRFSRESKSGISAFLNRPSSRPKI
jgi:enoyl-CoA hydratase/carnithine racemase